MESAKNNFSYRKIKSIINDNKFESDIEYRLMDFNIDNMKQINNENALIKNVLYDIQKAQKCTNDELYEFKNKNKSVSNKILYKNEKSKENNNNKILSDKLNEKSNIKKIKNNVHYKDIPLTTFFK